jgi:putative ABC transport system substrate-binding protein
MHNETRRRLLLGAAGVLVNSVTAARAIAASTRAPREVRLALLDNRYPDDRNMFIGDLLRTLSDTSIDTLRVAVDYVPREVRLDARQFGDLAARRRFDAFIVVGEESVRQVQRVAPSTPIVFHLSNDPRQSGMVESVQRPGGNVTGFASYAPTHRKRWELLREAFPHTERICVPVAAAWPHRREVMRDAQVESAKGIPITLLDIDVMGDIARQLRAGLRGRRLAVDIPFTSMTRFPGPLVDCLNDLGHPAIYDGTWYVHWDGLMSYEADPLPEVAMFAEYVNLIIHGTPPGLIPVRFPSSFTLALNAGTAARAGIAFPKSLLKRANLVVGADAA